MRPQNVLNGALRLIGAIFIAVGIASFIFYIMLLFGIYSSYCRCIIYSIVALVVIPLFRQSMLYNPLIAIFIALTNSCFIFEWY